MCQSLTGLLHITHWKPWQGFCRRQPGRRWGGRLGLDLQMWFRKTKCSQCFGQNFMPNKVLSYTHRINWWEISRDLQTWQEFPRGWTDSLEQSSGRTPSSWHQQWTVWEEIKNDFIFQELRERDHGADVTSFIVNQPSYCCCFNVQT